MGQVKEVQRASREFSQTNFKLLSMKGLASMDFSLKWYNYRRSKIGLVGGLDNVIFKSDDGNYGSVW
jgi:hypothetical protein